MELGCKQRSRAASASCRAFVIMSRVWVGSEVSSSRSSLTPWPELAATTDPIPVTPGLRSPGFCVFALLALPILLKWLSKLQLRPERKIYRSPVCVPAALFCAPEVRRWRVSCASGNDGSDRSANANGNRVSLRAERRGGSTFSRTLARASLSPGYRPGTRRAPPHTTDVPPRDRRAPRPGPPNFAQRCGPEDFPRSPTSVRSVRASLEGTTACARWLGALRLANEWH
jgi:hypothetical protein